MSSDYQLLPTQIERIYRNLPPEFIALVDEYPLAIASAAENYGQPPLPEGFAPQQVSIYLNEYTDGPAISADKRNGVTCHPDFWPQNPSVLMIEFIMEFMAEAGARLCSEWVYVRVGKVVVLNRLPQDYKLPNLENLKVSPPSAEDDELPF